MSNKRILDGLPFTTAMAAVKGYDRKSLTRLVERGALLRLFMSVYVDADVDLTMELRVEAARLALSEDMVLCDRTAAWIWGVDAFAFAELDGEMPLECCTPRGRRATERAGCDGGSRDLLPEDWCTIGGVRVTTPLRTALDLACNLWARDALAAMDALARGHGFTAQDLARLLPRYVRRRGVVQARRLVWLVDARAESAAESWTREVINLHGLPMPELQHWVLVDGVPTYRLDLAYVRAKIAVEYDGEEFHTSPADRQRDADRRAWLRAHGWYVIVLTKDSFKPEAIDRWVRELREVLKERTRSHKRF
ncbi:MAG: DUF559 domain-containing protein [Nocardioides sp.]